MKEVKEYIVIDGYSLNEIIEFINNRINVGWQPIGGISTRLQGINKDICIYTQAMVRYSQAPQTDKG